MARAASLWVAVLATYVAWAARPCVAVLRQHCLVVQAIQFGAAATDCEHIELNTSRNTATTGGPPLPLLRPCHFAVTLRPVDHASTQEPYLAPYQDAVARHGANFDALLWASPQTQRTRFDIITQDASPQGKFILDVGCGRADYLLYLRERRIRPARYIGIEGVDAFVAIAQSSPPGDDATILQGDFVREPKRLFIGADIILFSGSLNTLDDDDFRATIRHAYQAAGEALVFNFLCSRDLAGKDYLHWRSIADVERFSRDLCPKLRLFDDYLHGDCTACLFKNDFDRKEEDVHA